MGLENPCPGGILVSPRTVPDARGAWCPQAPGSAALAAARGARPGGGDCRGSRAGCAASRPERLPRSSAAAPHASCSPRVLVASFPVCRFKLVLICSHRLHGLAAREQQARRGARARGRRGRPGGAGATRDLHLTPGSPACVSQSGSLS